MIKLLWKSDYELNYEKVEWSGTDTQASRQVVFTIPTNHYDKGFSNAKIQLGDLIHLYDGKTQLFVGIVTSREKSAAIGTTSYTAKDFMHYLLRSNTSRIFRNKTPEQIVKNVCKEVGVQCGSLAKTKVNIPKLIFDDQSVYDIIIKAYRKASGTTKKKYMPKMEGKKLTIIVKGQDSKVTLDQAKDITDASYSDTTDNMVNLVRIYNDKKKQIGKVQNKTLTKKYGIYQSTYTKEKGVNAKKEAESMFVGVTQEASVEAIGKIGAIAGRSIVIYESATGLSGKFYVTSDTHTFENGIHTMQLQLAWRNTMESGADTESSSKSKTKKKTHSRSAVAYYLEDGKAYHSTPSCSALAGKNPRKTTVAAVLKIVNRRGKNKGKPKYKKCEKCWR